MCACVAYGCANRSTKKIPGVTFHRFPKDPERRASWVKAVNHKDWVPARTSVICSQHFKHDDFDRSSLCVVRLTETAVPSIFDAFPSYMKKVNKSRKAPCSRSNDGVESPHIQLMDTSVEEVFDEPDIPRQTELNAKRKIEKPQLKNETQGKKIKVLQQSKRRLQKKVASLSEILDSIKKRRLMEED